MFTKDCFHIDEGAQLQGLFKRKQLNESVSYKCVIPKTALYKILTAHFQFQRPGFTYTSSKYNMFMFYHCLYTIILSKL